jgi:O-antigen ligase
VSARARHRTQFRTASVLLATVVLAVSGALAALAAPRTLPAQDLVAVGARATSPPTVWKLLRADTQVDSQSPLGTWAVLPGLLLLVATAGALFRRGTGRGRTPRPVGPRYPQRGPPLTRRPA